MSQTNITFVIYLVTILGLFSRSMHGWVDQFAIEPKSLCIQKNGQKLEITTSLH